jgi:hypothetical protein
MTVPREGSSSVYHCAVDPFFLDDGDAHPRPFKLEAKGFGVRPRPSSAASTTNGDSLAIT